ncbi:MAG: hypothetical protein ABW049_09820 [Spongiibacteraceae bacterium]
MTELHSAADTLFQVIASGYPLPGETADQVQARLETQLKLPAATAARLLAGKPLVLKRALTATLAEDYCARLRGAGIAVEIAPMPAAEPAVPSTGAAPIIEYFADTQAINALVPISLRLRLWPQALQLLAAPLLYGLGVLLVLSIVLAFAIHFATLLRTPPLFFSLPVYLLPLLAGLTVVAILLRPLLPLRAATDASIAVAANREPQLLALLTQLCRRLGAAPPDSVHLHLDSPLDKNVAIALQPGRDGWQRGRYQLQIGLPLLMNASPAVLVGALAAELVFAREPALLRLRVIVSRVRDWLTPNTSPQPDRFSRYLESLPEKRWCDGLRRADRSARQQLANLFAKLSQHSSRRAERTLLQIGDRASIAVAGADVISARLLTTYQLERARERALQKNSERRIDRRRVDDLAPLVGFFFEHPDAEHDKKIARAIESGDAAQGSCCSDRERIAYAEKTRREFPPSALLGRITLHNADASGRDCTERFYTTNGTAGGERMPSERLLDDALLDLEQNEAGAIYFNNWLIPARGWRLPNVELLRDMPHADARLQLNVCVNEVRRLTPDRAKLLTEFALLQTQLNELAFGQQVLAANNKFSFRYSKYDGTSLTPLIEQRQRDIAKITEQLGTQESIMGGRIALGLKLFGQDGAGTEALHRTLHFLGEQEKVLYRQEQDTTLLEQLIQRQRQLKERGYTDAIARLTEKVRDTTLRLLDKLKDAPSPPDRRYAPLRDFFDDKEMEYRVDRSSSAAASVAARARSVLDAFYTLNEKLSLLAAEQASSVEEAYKIERIRLVNAE